jgi:four helix bundle protein
MKSYRDLIVWQKAMSLVVDVYKITEYFPDAEKFGLTSQIKRCSVSIPSNIAEGYGRNYTKDYIRFLQIARGSLFECQTQLE